MAELAREDWNEDAEPGPVMPREFVPDGPFGRGSGDDAGRPAWDTPPPANGEIDFPIPPSMRNRMSERPTWNTPAPEDGKIDYPIPPSMRRRMGEQSMGDAAASTKSEGGFSWPASTPRTESSRPTWETPPPADGEIDYPIPPSMRRAGQERPAWETPPPADGAIDFAWPPSLRRDDAELPAWDTPPPADGEIDYPIPPSMRQRMPERSSWETPAGSDEDLDFPWPPSMPRPGAAEQGWPPLTSTEDEQPGWRSGGWSLPEGEDEDAGAERPWLSASRPGSEDGEEAAGDKLDFPWPPSMPRPSSGSASSFDWPGLGNRPSERGTDDEAAADGQQAAAYAEAPEPPRRSEAAEEMLSRFAIPARGEELVSRPIAPLPSQDSDERAGEAAPPSARPRPRAEAPAATPAFTAGADPLIDAINRSKNGAAPLPITLITGVPPYPGIMGPLITHVASRLRAHRPWGWWDRLAAGHTMLANMLDALEREDLDGAVRYLNALLLDDALAEVDGALLVPLWNVDPEDQRGWAAFRALSGLVSLAVQHRRVVLHLIATSRAGHNRSAERDFDLVVPVEHLAVGAYDTATREALKAMSAGKEPSRERDLRLHLPIVQIQRRHDELILGVRAPEIEAKKGLGGLFKSNGKQREEEQFAAFGRQAMTTAFRWDPFLQYVHLTLLREDRGIRRSVLEVQGARADYPDADNEAA